jgi:D-arabinose 1-dehydrogenase-like Zn-dependent alcohol dehydrogenase
VSTTLEIPATSRAAVLDSFGEPLSLREVQVPSELERGAMLVKIETSSVCGSDIHLCAGAMAPSLKIELPVIPGHEMVGRIVRLGEGADRDSLGQPLEVGDRLLWSHGSCGRCHSCQVLRDPALCTNRRWYTFSSCARYPYLVGGFSEYCYVFPESGTVRVPDEIPSRWGSAAGCALRSVISSFERLGALEETQTVAIQGAGPLGLFATALARRRGAGRIIVIGAPQERLEVARAWGASDLVAIEDAGTAEARVAAVMDLTDGRGAAVTMEYSGANSAFAEGLEMTARGGRYLVVGPSGSQHCEVHPAMIATKSVRVIGSWSGDITHYWKALEFMRSAREEVDFDLMFGDPYALDEVNVAMERMRALEDIKPVIEFDV